MVSEERLWLVARAAEDVVWEWDATNDRMTWSDRFSMTYGHRGDAVPTGFEAWSRLVHPSDRVRVLASIEEWLAGDEESWSGEYALLRADGTYAPVLGRAFVVRDERGRPTRVMGALTDASGREAAKAETEAAGRAREWRRRTLLPALVTGAGVTALLLVLVLLSALTNPASVDGGIVFVGALLALALGMGVGAGVYHQRLR